MANGPAIGVVEIVKGADGERVGNEAGRYHTRNVGQGHQFHGNILAAIERGGVDGRGIDGQEAVAAVVEKGGVGFDAAQVDDLAGDVARLLAQFAGGGAGGRLAGMVGHARGQLQRNRTGAVAILPDHDHVVIGRQGDNVDPVGGLEDVEAVGLPGARRERLVLSQAEDAVAAEGGGAEDRPGFDHGGSLGQGWGNARGRGRLVVVSSGRLVVGARRRAQVVVVGKWGDAAGAIDGRCAWLVETGGGTV